MQNPHEGGDNTFLNQHTVKPGKSALANKTYSPLRHDFFFVPQISKLFICLLKGSFTEKYHFVKSLRLRSCEAQLYSRFSQKSGSVLEDQTLAIISVKAYFVVYKI